MPVVALLTDFGLQDHYAGALRGSILAACPEATLVDVTHDVPAHDVAAGALALDGAYPHFPAGTVFVAVVDPGVGSERRAVAIGAGRWLFVGPDNGIFTLVLDAHPPARVHLLANPELHRRPVSPVFHGRDLLGPAGARLARGMPLAEVGPRVDDPVRLAMPGPRAVAGGIEGVVIHVDRFGNLVTNLREADLSAAGKGEAVEARLGATRVPLVRTYSDVPPRAPCAIVGSSGRLEIALREGRADALAGRGAVVVVRFAGVLDSPAG